MLSAGQLVALAVEKPAAGGSMIARVDRQVVLVAGAIPGERVTARVERVGKGVAYAQTISVEEPSSDRREAVTDPLCGGCLYAHIAYGRQLDIKARVVADAFARIAKLELPGRVGVAPSPESGYRMRARLHLRAHRLGFFREGTHEICDARATQQLLPASCDVLERLAAGLRSVALDAAGELDISENIDASERALHLETAPAVDPRSLAALADIAGLTGLAISCQSPVGRRPSAVGSQQSAVGSRQSAVASQQPPVSAPTQMISGDPHVTDTLSIEGRSMSLRRHVLAFFQGNRYLLRDLAAHVVGQIEADGDVVDLYAGVGLFAIAAAVVHGVRVIAVEGDRVAARDLDANARASNHAVESVCQPVEAFTARADVRPRTLIVDPPRTGLSREALEGAIRLGARRIVYISCDVATLARDSRRLVDGGYAIRRIDAFDLFPNTPHIETVVVFDRTN